MLTSLGILPTLFCVSFLNGHCFNCLWLTEVRWPLYNKCKNKLLTRRLLSTLVVHCARCTQEHVLCFPVSLIELYQLLTISTYITHVVNSFHMNGGFGLRYALKIAFMSINRYQFVMITVMDFLLTASEYP